MQFQKFRFIKDSNVCNSVLIEETEIFNQIKTGGSHKKLVMDARLIGKGNPGYDKIKLKIPKIQWNAVFKDKIANKNIESFTNYIYCDIDKLPEIDEIKTYLKQFSFIRAIWKSVSGNGIGFIVNCDVVTRESFNQIYKSIGDYIGVKLDPNANKITQGNVLSFDPDIYINYDSTLFDTSSLIENNINIKSKKTYQKPNTISINYFDRLNIPRTNSENLDYNNKVTYTSLLLKKEREREAYVTLYNTKLNYKTYLADEEFGNDEYKLIPKGRNYVEVYIPRHGVFEGERTMSIYHIIIKLIFLNPMARMEEILTAVLDINECRFHPPIEEDEVKKTVTKCWDNYINDELHVPYKIKKIWFRENSTLSKKEKLKICGELSGKLRREGTIDMLIDGMLTLIKQDSKITQKILAKASGVSVRTIKRYWDKLKEIVDMAYEETEQNSNSMCSRVCMN